MEVTQELLVRACLLGACTDLPVVGSDVLRVTHAAACWVETNELLTPQELAELCDDPRTSRGRLQVSLLSLHGKGMGDRRIGDTVVVYDNGSGFGYGLGYGYSCGLGHGFGIDCGGEHGWGCHDYGGSYGDGAGTGYGDCYGDSDVSGKGGRLPAAEELEYEDDR